MAFNHIHFNDQTTYGRMLRRMLQMAEESDDLMRDVRAVMIQMRDGDHSYEAVVADIRAWLPKVKRPGVLAGHDFDMDGVRRAVERELHGRFRTWGRCWIADLSNG